MHEIGRFKIMITPRRKIKAEAKLQQTRERNKRKKIKAEAAAKQAEHIAFETEAKCTKAAAAAEAASKETISDLPTDFFNLKVIIQNLNETAEEKDWPKTPTTVEDYEHSWLRYLSADEISCNGKSLLTSNLFGDFSPNENMDYFEKDEPSSYEKPSSLVEPLICVIDMNVPIGIPLD
jgi:hypothetical protein